MFCIEFIIVENEVLYVLRTADGRIIKSTYDSDALKSELESMSARWLEQSKNSQSKD